MTEKRLTLTKKELLDFLEPYDDDKLIAFKVNMKEDVVGFYDLEKDIKYSDNDKLVLKSDALSKWYAEDIKELTEENEKLKKDKKELIFDNEQLMNFISSKGYSLKEVIVFCKELQE